MAGVEFRAIGANALVHGSQKLGVGVIADACLLVGGNVGGIQSAKRHVEGEAACERRAARGGMAGLAICSVSEIFAALHQIGIGELDRNAGDVAALVVLHRHGRAAGEGHWVTAKKQPACNTKRRHDNDRSDHAKGLFHGHADLAAALLIARRIRI